MWDWILIANLVGPLVIFTLLGLMVAFSAVFGVLCLLDKENNVHSGHVVLGFFIAILFSLFCTMGELPERVIISNIDRIKIYYTSPQAVKKAESGALKVIDKLNKLIDKGINSIDNQPTTEPNSD